MPDDRRPAEESGMPEVDGASCLPLQALAAISHDIKSPLRAIIAQLSRFEEMEDGDAARRVQLMQSSARRIERLVQDILDMGKFEERGVDVVDENFNLREMLEETIECQKPLAEESGLEIGFDMQDDVPESVRGDQDRLGQVLDNLVTNGLRYTDRGSVRVSVQVREKSEDELVLEFHVDDTGQGIDKDDQEDLFRDFSQLVRDNPEGRHGAGLGLAICRRVVEAMGGSIWVESDPGEGTSFRFTVSLAPADDVNGDQDLEELPNLSILLADDDPLTVSVTQELLESSGHSVKTAGDGAAALERLKSETFDVALLDVRMPEMDGAEVCRRIRSGEGQDATMPIFAFSADDTPWDEEEVTHSGMDGLLPKPLDMKRFEDEVRTRLYPDSTRPQSSGEQRNVEGLIDADALRRQFGKKPEVFGELKDSFLSGAREKMQTMQRALDRQEWENLAETAHSLKGSAAVMGAMKLRDEAKELQQVAEQEHNDEVGVLLERLESDLDATEDALGEIGSEQE
ncbi:ATP-binding protein [Desulfovibrio oxyclinae]|uniref:ATP-binding protein n=1 Tax=Desulfovibrio oxyclinae TaxID=63560 RepID=UPI00037A1172|nr:ATP-binding protein [Desulfovibrio oxyclinae]